MVNYAMTKNVIEFPLERRMKEIHDKKISISFDSDEDMHYDTVEMTSDIILTDLIESAFEADFRIDGEKYMYDLSFVYESVRSLLLKSKDIHHPAQLIAEEMFSTILADEEFYSKQLELDFGEDDGFTISQ